MDNEWAPEKRLKEAADELAKPAAYLALPFGGGQIKRVFEAIDAVRRGGVYTLDAEGEEQLQYPVYNDTFWEAVANGLRAAVFGRTSLPTGREWVESGFGTLSAKQTAAYKGMVDVGVPGEEAYSLVQELQGLKAAEQRKTLRSADISGGRIGRPLLHHLQQHVLVLFRQQGAVRKHIDLPPPLVGADVGVCPDGAHHVHGDVLMVWVPDGDHVRMDARQHLPAGGADAAGAALLPRALQGGGGKAGGGHPVAAAGEQQGVGQGAASGGLPDADGGWLLRPQAEQGHGVLSFSRCEHGLICRFSGGAGCLGRPAAFRRAHWSHCTTWPRKRKERKYFLCCATVNCVDCTNICENTPAIPKFLSIFMYCFPKKFPI